MVDNIDLNPGWTAPTDMTTEVTGMESFVRIGKGKIFAGTFDGQGHTISGICGRGDQYAVGAMSEIFTLPTGLFSNTQAKCVIKDFKLLNSFFFSDLNEWAYEKTNGLIQDIVGPGQYSLILANALYYKAGWMDDFKNDGDKTFIPEKGANVVVPFIKCEKESMGYNIYVRQNRL